jgi:uncharacterized membrane protein
VRRWSFAPRRIFVAGLLVALPSVLAGYLLWLGFAYFDGILEPLVQHTFHRRLPGVGFVALGTFIFLVGLFASNLLGARIVSFVSRSLERIPVYSPVYRAMRDISQVFLGDKAAAFRRVVLIEWPRPGMWAIAFVMAESGGAAEAAVGGSLVTVFVPSTPNPTTGFMQLVAREGVISVDMSVEQALKLLISGGATVGPGTEPRHRAAVARGQDAPAAG